MTKYVKQYGRVLVFVLPVVLVVAAFALWPAAATGGVYSTPFWAQNSPSPECSGCEACGCPTPPEWSPEGVSYRTGELRVDHHLFSMPGLVSDNSFGLRWRSMNGGVSQLGRRVIPSWEYTAEQRILIPGTPNGPGGHEVWIRRPRGTIDVFDWDGSSYSAASCLVYDTLTTGLSGNYELTDKYGNRLAFDLNGMPNVYTDRNGNDRTWTYNSSQQLTGYTDDRGLSYTVAQNSNGFIASITDPASRTWSFGYDSSDNLTTITTPATTDQPSGITTTLVYDVSNRLTGITDGRGNTVREWTYQAGTDEVATAKIDGVAISYSFASGVTTRTDRASNVRRVYHSGSTITSTDMLVGGVASFTKQWGYTGNQVSYMVNARSARTDYTWDSKGNMLERRRKETNTASTSSSDIVESWTYDATTNVPISYADPMGEVQTYVTDSAGNRTQTTYPNVTVPAAQSAYESWTYNSSGQVLTHTNEEGVLTTKVYYSSGTSIGLLHENELGPSGSQLTTTFAYDSAGNMSSRTDPLGHVYSFTYDNLRRLKETEAPSPLSYRVRSNYDANGNRVLEEIENFDKDGNLVTANPWFTKSWVYTIEDQVSSVTEEIDASTTRTTSFTYDANGNLYQVTKPEGNIERKSYGPRDELKAEIRGYGATGQSTRSFAYDANLNLVTVTDGRGNDSTFEYDLFDRRTKAVDQAGHYSETDHDKRGSVTELRRKDSSGTLLQRSTRYFDERGRAWKSSDLHKDPSTTYADAVTTATLRRDGLVVSRANALGGATTSTFDAYGRLSTTTDTLGNEVTNEYDSNSRLKAYEFDETGPSGTVTHRFESSFDALGRVIATSEVNRLNGLEKRTTTTGYDSRSNRVWFVDAEGNPTRFKVDGLGQIIESERAATLGATINDFTTSQVTTYGFDSNMRRTSHADDASNTTTWSYDQLDRVDDMTHPDATTVSYQYDKNDNVTQTTDAAGNVITDTFDVRNLHTARTVTLVSGYLGTTSETRTFDALGRLSSAADSDYHVALSYGVLGMSSTPYSETQKYVTGSALPVTVTTKTNAMGQKISEAYPSGLNLTYTRNTRGALTSTSDGTNTIASLTYSGLRIEGVTFQNGTTQSNSFTGYRGELATIHHKTSASVTLLQLDYGYDANHDRLFERFGTSGSTGDGFAYDRLRRLSSAWMGSATPSNPTSAGYDEKIEFGMDDDGNRSGVVTTPFGGSPSTENYVDNNLNQYTSVGGVSHAHNANGSLADDGSKLYKYDYRGQLVEVRNKSTNALEAEYKYDALGRRVEKDAGSTNHRYIYSGPETIEVRQAAGGWLQRFVFGDRIDSVVMLEQADVADYDGDADVTELTRSFYHTNALGSVMYISDMAEAEVASYRYTPYGDVTITEGGAIQSTDPLGQPWGYTARMLDPETGLMYYRARTYDPATGRFLQRDPMGFDTGPNNYAYALHTPLNATDPTGEVAEKGPDGKAVPGTADDYDGPKGPAEERPKQEIGKDGARLAQFGKQCCFNFELAYTGVKGHKYAVVQYYSIHVWWARKKGDPVRKPDYTAPYAKDVNSGTDPDGENPWYPDDRSTDSEGRPRIGTRDGPGTSHSSSSDSAAEMNKLVKLLNGAKAAKGAIPSTGWKPYLSFEVRFRTYVVDLTAKKVVKRVTWRYWIRIFANNRAGSRIKVGSSGPTESASLGAMPR